MVDIQEEVVVLIHVVDLDMADMDAALLLS
jgi:hypothetical protein